MKEEEKQFSIDAIVKQTVLESFKAAEKDLDDKLNKTLETIETVKQELSEKVKDLLIDSIGTDGKDGEKGDKGEKGEQGEKGEDGKDGKDGIDGIDGVDGQRGPAPKHRWKGTALAFQNPDGSWGKEVDLKGKDGSDGRSSLFGRGASSLSIYRNGAVFTTGAINFIGGTITGDQNIMNIDLSASGGGTWGTITGTLSDQTDLQTALNAKQDTLVSGTSIKTINSTSLLGSGDISITSNATHTGDVTGATVLTIDPTAITGKTAVTAVGTDYVLISDTSDSGNLKKALVSDFGSGASEWTETGGVLSPTTGTDTVLVTTKISVGDDDTMSINGTTVDSKLALHSDSGTAGVAELELHRHSSTAGRAATVYGARSRGTGASPTVVQADDNLLDEYSVGYDGTDYALATQIAHEVDGTPGNNDMPGRIVFKTSQDGGQTPTEALRIDSAQNVKVATALTGTYLTASEILITDSNKKVVSAPVATYPSLTELSYVKGVTSAIQTQLGARLPLSGGIMTGNVELTASPASDTTSSGVTTSVTVDTNSVGFGAALVLASDGHFDEADADSATTMPCTALAIETGTGTKKVLLHGFIRNDAWNWTVGGAIYVSQTQGTLTQTAPSASGKQVQIVGYAYTADIIYFNPSLTIIEV